VDIDGYQLIPVPVSRNCRHSATAKHFQWSRCFHFYFLAVNKWSKTCDQRPHRRLVTPCGDEWIRPTITPIYKLYASLCPQESSPKRHPNRFSRFCTAYGRMSLYFTTEPPSNMVRNTHPSQHPKRHLDRFSRFAGFMDVTNRQTDRASTLLSVQQ